MKAVILAGGLGTRISEESHLKPKPMIEIGGKPILWHIMKQYSAHGIHDFVICLGYKGYAIKDFFANYFLHTSDVTFDMRNNRMDVHQNYSEPWSVTLIDTGEETMTGGRLLRAGRYLKDEEAFCFTYGDGVSDVDITALIAFIRSLNNHRNRLRWSDVKADFRLNSDDVIGFKNLFDLTYSFGHHESAAHYFSTRSPPATAARAASPSAIIFSAAFSNRFLPKCTKTKNTRMIATKIKPPHFKLEESCS